MKNLRIMIFNAGYFTGITGSRKEYFFKARHLLYPSLATKHQTAERLVEVIKEVQPDILFMSEIHDASHLGPIKELFAESRIDKKYKPGSFLHHTPFFRGNGNGVFLRNTLPIHALFLRDGTKRLLYRVDITKDCSLFFSHLALGRKTRERQIAEMAELALQKKQVIIAGDFNTFYGMVELEHLLSKAGLSVVNRFHEKTFPAIKPTHALDLFLASPSIQIKDIRVLTEVLLSDHLPVVADFELPDDGS